MSGERRVPGIEGAARVLARGTIVVGQSLDDRDEVLAGLIAAFAIGGPLAILIASLLGYGLAGSAMRPVEAMRRRAAAGDERLPLPAAHDEIHRLGETLNGLLARLRGSIERERRFVADASHELRTPLAVLKTELEARACAIPIRMPAIASAIEEVDRLSQLAEDLLVLARSEEGELPVRRETLHVRPLLEGVRDRFADRASPRRPRHPRRGRRRDDQRRSAAAAPGARQPGRQRAAPRRAATSSCARRRTTAASRWRSPTAARASRRTSPSARSSASPAATGRARAAAPVSASRSCARSPRRTAGARRSKGSTVRVWMPSQGRLSEAVQDPQP